MPVSKEDKQMITPLDIQTKTFSNSPLGYKKAEVDAFKDEILAQYEALYKANKDAEEKIKNLNKLVESYKSMEETMKNTLIVAQSSAEQLTSAARSEADAIVNQANQKANDIISKANEKLNRICSDFEGVKKDVALFVMRTKSELQLQIDALEKSGKELEDSTI